MRDELVAPPMREERPGAVRTQLWRLSVHDAYDSVPAPARGPGVQCVGRGRFGVQPRNPKSRESRPGKTGIFLNCPAYYFKTAVLSSWLPNFLCLGLVQTQAIRCALAGRHASRNLQLLYLFD